MAKRDFAMLESDPIEMDSGCEYEAGTHKGVFPSPLSAEITILGVTSDAASMTR